MNWHDTYYENNFLDEELLNKYKEFIPKDQDDTNFDDEYNDTMTMINEFKKSSMETLKKQTSLNILEEELKIIKLLSKYTLQNNYLNYSFFLKSLDLLLELSSILSVRLKLQTIEHKMKNYNNYIPRCSYKFCNFKNDCFYNYNKKTKNICYQDHYVHNMVSADLIILIDYIKQKFNESKLIIPNKEILKSINTLSYVVEHMHSELKSRCLYMKDNEIEKEHFIKKNK